MAVVVGWIALRSDGTLPVDEPVGERVDLYGDPLPPGALARLGTLRYRGGAHAACDLVFDDDGRTLWTPFNDRRVMAMDLETGERLRLLRGHRERVRVPGRYPDWEDILKGRPRRDIVDDALHVMFRDVRGGGLLSVGRTLRRIDLETGDSEILHTWPTWVYSPTLSHDGRWLAVRTQSEILVHDLETGGVSVLHRFGFPSTPQQMMFAPDSPRLAWTERSAAGSGIDVHIVDLDDDDADDVHIELTDPNEAWPVFRFSLWGPDNRLWFRSAERVRFVHGSGSPEWGALPTPPASAERPPPRYPLGPPALSPDDRLLVVPWGSGLEIWDLETNAFLRVIRTPETGIFRLGSPRTLGGWSCAESAESSASSTSPPGRRSLRITDTAA